MTGLKTLSQGHLTALKWWRQVTPPYSREHFIMNLWDAFSPCSRHACPASYSGSYLNNWFQILESQCCEFHAYREAEERFFNRACSMHGGGENACFMSLENMNTPQTVNKEISPHDKAQGWHGLTFVGCCMGWHWNLPKSSVKSLGNSWHRAWIKLANQTRLKHCATSLPVAMPQNAVFSNHILQVHGPTPESP